MKRSTRTIVIIVFILITAILTVIAVAYHYRLPYMIKPTNYAIVNTVSLNQGESEKTEFIAKKEGIYCLSPSYFINSYKNYSEHDIDCNVKLTDSDNYSVDAQAISRETEDNSTPYDINHNLSHRSYCYTVLKENEKYTVEAKNNETKECNIKATYVSYFFGGKKMKMGINQARATGSAGLYYFTAEKDGYYNFKSYFGALMNPMFDKVYNPFYERDEVDKMKRNIDYTIKLSKGEDFIFMISSHNADPERVELPFLLNISYVGETAKK